ncbi:CotH kinase family protein [Croceiramulus getboli]|nr:CotH kinase family protein [Flavobacteriaceae bacterium YJPT1-3]
MMINYFRQLLSRCHKQATDLICAPVVVGRSLFDRKEFLFAPLLFGVLVLSVGEAGSQSHRAEEGSFGVDASQRMIVWQADQEDSLLLNTSKKLRLQFDEAYRLSPSSGSSKSTYSYVLKKQGEEFKLYLSKYPIIHLSIDTTAINSRKKVLAKFSYFDQGNLMESLVGIRYRGNLSLSFPKKNYDLEFWSDSLGRENKDVRFADMRSDDDWILDGLYNEPLRLRSTLAMRLWLDMHPPYYSEQRPEAKSAVRSKFVEVFRNGKYLGIYALSESVDRKQLDLKKNEGEQVYGELFKAESYENATSFKKAAPYNNLFPHWSGFRMEYPLIDYKAHWNDLAKTVTLVAEESDENFKARIDKEIHIPNAIDYFILVNLLRATDNLGKNYYLGRYQQGEPYFFIPWDLDGVLGSIQDGKRIATTNDILSNALFDRLIEVNPDNYKDKLKSRWSALREKDLKTVTLTKSMDTYVNRFEKEELYDREFKTWPAARSLEDHYSYLRSWLEARLEFLDQYFKSL